MKKCLIKRKLKGKIGFCEKREDWDVVYFRKIDRTKPSTKSDLILFEIAILAIIFVCLIMSVIFIIVFYCLYNLIF